MHTAEAHGFAANSAPANMIRMVFLSAYASSRTWFPYCPRIQEFSEVFEDGAALGRA